MLLIKLSYAQLINYLQNDRFQRKIKQKLPPRLNFVLTRQYSHLTCKAKTPQVADTECH